MNCCSFYNQERVGRVKILSSSTGGQLGADSNGLNCLDLHKNSMPTPSVDTVGDEVMLGAVKDQLGPKLGSKLHSICCSMLQLSKDQFGIVKK